MWNWQNSRLWRFPQTWAYQNRIFHEKASKCLKSHEQLKLYLIAGEPSGDAIGAKVIRALHRQLRSHHTSFVIRGIGGSQMCHEGKFSSLFPMQELSIMGIIEVIPSLWRLRRRLRETLADIQEFQPHLVLTIDSKGFTFQVHRSLANTNKSILRMHYIAPSEWAYKHRQWKHSTALKVHRLASLLDHLFVILPFEESIFQRNTKMHRKERQWCTFVGNPSIEDFLEIHCCFGYPTNKQTENSSMYPIEKRFDKESLVLRYPSHYLPSMKQVALFKAMLQKAWTNTHKDDRQQYGIPPNAFVICVLFGSRVNEVVKTREIVMSGIQSFIKAHPNLDFHFVFPTITPVVKYIAEFVAKTLSYSILMDLTANQRYELFKLSDLAIAVSGTIVMETALASLPTAVIYKANRITEMIASRLAAVRYVSILNLLIGRFANCNSFT